MGMKKNKLKTMNICYIGFKGNQNFALLVTRAHLAQWNRIVPFIQYHTKTPDLLSDIKGHLYKLNRKMCKLGGLIINDGLITRS